MATKGPVLSIAELPAFVRSSPVHRSLQTTKDMATRLASLPPPEHYPRLRRFLSRRQVQTSGPKQGSQVRSCLINLINFFEQQPCKRTRVKQETVIHPDFKAQEYS